MSIDKSKILETAQQYTGRGQIQKAIDEWKKLLTDNPNDANIYNSIGDMYLKYQTNEQGKDDAIANYVKAAEIFESSGFALKAIAVLKKILKIVPSSKDIYIRLGNLNCERGLIGNAREDYLAAAKLYSQDGQVREALDVYRKIADLDPANLNVRLKIADIYLKEDLISEAIEEYNKVASVHVESGRWDEAESIYRLILRVAPDNVDTLIKIGRIRLQDGYFEEAMAFVKKALERSPDSEEAFSILIDIYDKTKMYDEAEEIIKNRIYDNPDQIVYRDLLGSILLNKGDLKRATDEYLSLSRDCLERNLIEKAFEYAEKTIDITPDLICAHENLFDVAVALDKKHKVEDRGLFLAKYYYESGEILKSADYYKKILEINPSSLEAKEGYAKTQPESEPEIQNSEVFSVTTDTSEQLASADAFMKYGLIEKAVDGYQSALSVDPNSKIAHSRLKDAYKAAGDVSRAIEECLILLKIYEEEDEGDSIVELIQEAIAINPNDHRIQEYRDKLIPHVHAEINELLEEAGFYAQQGMFDEAAAVYKKILLVCPDNQEASARLIDLRGVQSDTAVPAVEILPDDNGPSSSFFDLGEVLKDAEIEEPVRPFAQEEEPIIKSFDDLFHEFQDGIRSQLGSEDYETHYNLGIAYKEMGLCQEAIEEFKLCLPGEDRFTDASFMIALCHKDVCEYSEAADILMETLTNPSYDVRSQLVLKYELGEILEMLGKKDDAFTVFQEIYEIDPTYRNVSEKVLSPQ
ncbi:MAG: tetratricopeptide repeat protein [Nitrospirae bacterium]|nr:tetratricopeptide repeat protein [Nitrospirota bacterium]